jgi:amino acid transporter
VLLSSGSAAPSIRIATAVIVLMLVIAIIGIKITARIQVSMAIVEYTILLGFAIAGFVLVLGHHHGTFPITRDWFNPSGIGGKGSLASGFLIAVFIHRLAGRDVSLLEQPRAGSISPHRAGS